MFAEQQSTGAISRTPFLALLTNQRREVLLAAGCMLGFFGFIYTANTFMASYARTHVGFSPNVILSVNVVGGVVALVFCAASALACDRFGRRRVIMVALAAGVPWAFVLIPLVDTGNAGLFTRSRLLGAYAVAGASYGPLGAFVPELFATRYRYSGAGLALNIAGLVGGALPPLIAAPLAAVWGGVAIGVMLAGFVGLSLVSRLRLPETKPL